VAPMAICASGCRAIMVRQGEPMGAGAKAFRLVTVADRALHRFSGDVVLGMRFLQVGMATGAVVGLVDGSFELRFIDKQGDGFAGRIGFDQRLVGMAFQAIAIFHNGGSETGTRQQQSGPDYCKICSR